ncbi:hypothetical protein GGI06_000382 [Coemansia sp. S85]|nr:hypothetical protein GGI06_000382 [Coemansia sp. S85]
MATGIPATEHLVMTAYSSEWQAMLSTIEAYGGGVFACVKDSYDYSCMLSEVLPVVTSKKLEKGGYLVICPNNYDQMEAMLLGLRAADKVFRSVVRSKGYRVVTGTSVIQGNGMTPESLQHILAAVHGARYLAQSVWFVMDGGLLQKGNRDTMSMATKLSSIMYADGETRDIMKFPKEGSEKVSLPGKFAMHADPDQGSASVAFCKEERRPARSENLLQAVYKGGPVDPNIWDGFAMARQRVSDPWHIRS